ncbi:unnamed protein product [Amoebophrya sp. A25]|nr:unnamed protein product [Amoebophrya sp. A25]|eukprot:GSA25T00007600001.1
MSSNKKGSSLLVTGKWTGGGGSSSSNGDFSKHKKQLLPVTPVEGRSPASRPDTSPAKPSDAGLQAKKYRPSSAPPADEMIASCRRASESDDPVVAVSLPRALMAESAQPKIDHCLMDDAGFCSSSDDGSPNESGSGGTAAKDRFSNMRGDREAEEEVVRLGVPRYEDLDALLLSRRDDDEAFGFDEADGQQTSSTGLASKSNKGSAAGGTTASAPASSFPSSSRNRPRCGNGQTSAHKKITSSSSSIEYENTDPWSFSTPMNIKSREDNGGQNVVEKWNHTSRTNATTPTSKPSSRNVGSGVDHEFDSEEDEQSHRVWEKGGDPFELESGAFQHPPSDHYDTKNASPTRRVGVAWSSKSKSQKIENTKRGFQQHGCPQRTSSTSPVSITTDAYNTSTRGKKMYHENDNTRSVNPHKKKHFHQDETSIENRKSSRSSQVSTSSLCTMSAVQLFSS